MTSVLAVVGPTASGKTAFAIDLAERLQTEILSADSMQVFRGMEIGTAAPTPDQLRRIKHHFVGILAPDEDFSAGEFQRRARLVIEELNAKGKVAVVVGGSGLYISALIDGLFEGPAKNDAIRERLHAEAACGKPLYERLETVDPAYAAVIDANDLRRIVRALEVFEITGRPISELHREHQHQTPPLSSVQVALDVPRPVLYERINARVDRMINNGFVQEVQRLIERGYRPHLDRLRSVGYREFAAYLDGTQSLEEARETMKKQTRRFAKRQLTWFRAYPRIHWMPLEGNAHTEEHIQYALGLLS